MPSDHSPKHRFPLFVPILAGATARERAIGCLGALVGIAVTGLFCGWLAGLGPQFPLIVAPIGASAVLLFAVPASPLAQPWPIIGGNTISAFVGILVAHLVHEPVLAIGLAVSLAIAVMSLTRSLHPPGGAAALTAALGGPAVASAGFLFPLVPVGLNSVLLVAIGIAFHRLARRRYPHVVVPPTGNQHRTSDIPTPLRVGFRGEDIDAALRSFDETFDIDRADLDRLLRQVELQALIRSTGAVLCRDVMSRDVVRVGLDARSEAARKLLIDHNIRTLPVVDDRDELVGTIGLRELAGDAEFIAGLVSESATAAPDDPALGLVPLLTDGRTHAAIIVGEDRRIAGLISQTDLFALLAKTHMLSSG
ncbi:HPP family protein [Kaistia algarum]|uniref:HPP family protein n=1 Tax=Kaistia algarum TaxID=2083279 RepID=UPI002253AC66|nr:HPP family protein [Kaistia algarum]MCX5515792.1 HPP family protein [Kaistia algarum]